LELVGLRPPGVGNPVRVEQAVQIIESLAEFGSLEVEYLHVLTRQLRGAG
jgi:hypothetical protein